MRSFCRSELNDWRALLTFSLPKVFQRASISSFKQFLQCGDARAGRHILGSTARLGKKSATNPHQYREQTDWDLCHGRNSSLFLGANLDAEAARMIARRFLPLDVLGRTSVSVIAFATARE